MVVIVVIIVPHSSIPCYPTVSTWSSNLVGNRQKPRILRSRSVKPREIPRSLTLNPEFYLSVIGEFEKLGGAFSSRLAVKVPGVNIGATLLQHSVENEPSKLKTHKTSSAE